VATKAIYCLFSMVHSQLEKVQVKKQWGSAPLKDSTANKHASYSIEYTGRVTPRRKLCQDHISPRWYP
jgi:hypothetical protein